MPFFGSTGTTSYTASVLVVGGGGGSSGNAGSASGLGGGGAGGYVYQSAYTIVKGKAYSLIVGAGGAAGTSVTTLPRFAFSGNSSTFDALVACGGGNGAPYVNNGGNGGSGGAGGNNSSNARSGVAVALGQGFAGGYLVGGGYGGGGGGAGAIGGTGTASVAGSGGVGVVNPISTSTLGQNVSGTLYVCGGGTSGYGTSAPSSAPAGGNGGGGAGAYASGLTYFPPANGTANTGGGAGGSGNVTSAGAQGGASGGSGCVSIKIPSSLTATFSAGVTQTNSTTGGFTTYDITATSTTSETVTFS